MANPQMENGFTPVANEILEATAGASLNGTQLRILLLLWRNSYGFHQTDCALPLSYLEKKLRGNKSTIARQLRGLERMGVIFSALPDKNDGRTPKRYAFNKNYEGWQCGAGEVSLQALHGGMGASTVGKSGNLSCVREPTYKDNYKNNNKYIYKNNAKRKSRYDFEDIERQVFLNVTQGHGKEFDDNETNEK